MLSHQQTAFAADARLAHLATTDANGQPHVVPITFVLMDGALYFAVDEKPKRTKHLKRLRNIEENPSVALVIDRYDEDWSKLGWLMVQGEATVIDNTGVRELVVRALREKYGQYRDMPLAGPLVKIVPSKVLGWGDIS